MTPSTLPASLLEFLSRRKSLIRMRTYSGGDLELELEAGRELDSAVGALRFCGISLYGNVENAESIGKILMGTVDDLPEDQRKAMEELPGGQVFVFESPDGRRFHCVANGLKFSLRPWFDAALTDRVRCLNAEQGHSAKEAVRSHFAASAAELLGREVVCLRCLRRFRYEKEFAICPACGSSAGPFSPEELLKSFFHFHTRQELYERSGCGPLQGNDGGVERYRLIVYSYWLNHRVVEVERTPMAAHLVAKAWNWHEDAWVETANRRLSPTEWRRFSQLIHLAPFWELSPNGGHHGFDGADYVLEGMREGCYHYVGRWRPDPATDQENFSFACEYLLELAAHATQAASD